jgi:hypothetical protein
MDASDCLPFLGIIFVIWWIAAAFVVGTAADVRGRKRGPWFWLSFFLGPILAVLLLIAFPAAGESNIQSSD